MTKRTRREFLGESAAFAAAMGIAPMAFAEGRAAMTGRASKPLDLLMLGGTGFLGPHIVWRALERGHNVTLFNRGQTGPDLFPDLDLIEGDRYSDLSNLKAAVEDGRTWHGAIDTFAYVPSVVTDMMDVIKDAVEHYTLVSTVSVYAGFDTVGADESAPKAEISDEVAAGIPTHREVGVHYGAMKMRCEEAGNAGMPGRIANVRPGLIVGPRDTTGRFTYWAVRGSEGGTMIAPGEPTDPVQVIDVRDLADFIVLAFEKKLWGPYNAISPAGHFSIGDVVDSAIKVGDAGTKAEWIDADFLAAHGVNGWQHMPAWVSQSTPGYAGFGTSNCQKAVQAGMTIRPMDETMRATLEYYRTRGPEIEAERGEEFGAQWRQSVRGGLPRELEAEVLEAWNSRG